MNKRMIAMIALVAVVSLMPASAETLEVRGTIVELGPGNPTIAVSACTPLYVADYDNDAANGLQPGFQWDYSSFAGFWYDLDDDLQTEHLTILEVPPAPGNPLAYPGRREIAEGGLVYTTCPVFQEYEMHQDIEPDPARPQTTMETIHDAFFERGPGSTGLCVESDNAGGDCGYFIEGWMGEQYVAIDNNADKLCKLLVEFEDDDTKTLYLGEGWNLSGGFAFELLGIDDTGKEATLRLSKNGGLLATGTLDTSGSEQDRVYTYTADIGGEDDIPVFSCYLNAIFNGTDTVEIMYVFLIDDDVLEIETTQTYGAMEVMTASSSEVVLKNDATPIDLDTDSNEHIMGNIYFQTADDDINNNIRFYPYVEYTEPGTYEVRGTIAEFDLTNPTIALSPMEPLYVADYDGDPTNGADRPGFQWDYSSFAGFWYDLDDDLQTEHLTILETPPAPGNPLAYPGRREIAEGGLIYTTHPVFQEYELHQDIEPSPARPQTDMEADYDAFFERGIGSTGLCVESDNAGGDCGYFLEGWMGEQYVAIDGNADKLCKLLVEFEDDDTKTLYLGEGWNLSGGFAFELLGIDDTGKEATLRLSKNGIPLEESQKCIDTGSVDKQDCVYTYTVDIGDEEDIPVFSCYVDAIFKGSTSYVQLMYVFLIDDDVLEIKTSQTYGAMEVMTASCCNIVLTNDETAIDLDPGTTKNITDSMYFRIADDDTAIRFYPFVERTIGGEEPTPPATIPAKDIDGDGVPDVWDADNSTPSDYWVNSDGIGRKWGDMNGDGELTSVDALMILQAAVGKIELG